MQHKPILDLDGVFADFIGGIHRAMGIPYDEQKWPYPREWDWFAYSPFSVEEANAKCTSRFWETLPWTSDGQELYRMIRSYFIQPSQMTILTRPMRHTGSYTGKAKWIDKNMPDMWNRLIPTWVDKYEFAHEQALLIDDREETCIAFTAHGGSAIVVPRPWNSLYQCFEQGDSVEYVERELLQWAHEHHYPLPRKESNA